MLRLLTFEGHMLAPIRGSQWPAFFYRIQMSELEHEILEDDGTIHLYLSSRNAAALANHTDVTDIFVLQLDGAKEWTLCEETGFDTDKFRDKLSTCTTYSDFEIDNLVCKRTTLHPGDALYLPKRVVHSARASEEMF